METAFRSEERFSKEQFWAWLAERPARDLHRYELIGEQIVMTPPPGWPHGGLEGTIIGLLARHVRPTRIGIVCGSGTGYELPTGDVLQPDVSFISKERYAAGPEPIRGKCLRIVPDLVVEILSPSTASRDSIEKLRIYAQSGVDEYWLVDARRSSVTVLHRERGTYGRPAIVTQGKLPCPVLPALDVSVEEIFGDLDLVAD